MISNRFRALVNQALGMAGPIAAAYLVVVAGLLVEVLIIGNEIGGLGVAAYGLAGTLSLVMVLAFHAIEIATQSIVARRYGEGNLLAAGEVLDNSLALSFAFGIPLTISLYGFGSRLFGASDPEVEALAIQYFLWRLPSIPFFIAALAMIGFFNAIGRPKVPMFVYAAILLLNALFCFLLVRGELGLPRMGIAGAGAAQSIAALAGFAIFLRILTHRHYRMRFRVLSFGAHLNRRIMRALMLLGAPVFIQQLLGNFGFYIFMIINGKISDEGVSLAAATIARHVGYITYLPSLGFGVAAAAMASRGLGAGKSRDAAQAVWVCWGMGAAFMVTIGVLFILFREWLAVQFLTETDSGSEAHAAAVAATAASLLVIVGCYQIFESLNTILGKALQGAGATIFVMITSVSFQWGVFIPLAYFLALPMGWGAQGALLAMAIQLALAGTTFLIKFSMGGWKKKRL